MEARRMIVVLSHSTTSESPERSNLIHSRAPAAFFLPFPAAAAAAAADTRLFPAGGDGGGRGGESADDFLIRRRAVVRRKDNGFFPMALCEDCDWN